MGFGELKIETDKDQHLFEIQVYLNNLDRQAIKVELYSAAMTKEMEYHGPDSQFSEWAYLSRGGSNSSIRHPASLLESSPIFQELLFLSNRIKSYGKGKIMKISPLAGKPPPPSMLVNVPNLIKAYYTGIPDPSIPAQRVEFGTSGHRGSSLDKSFNENHILAISQAICLYRTQQKIDGPLFLGMDTHALSLPALKSALEVLAANGVTVMLSVGDEYTPTPAISHAILTYNRGRKSQLADGIVITPSHNPPSEGGFKYNPPNGGPAEPLITNWIQDKANEFLENKMSGVKRIPFEKALHSSTTKRHNYLKAYVADLANVIDMEAIRKSKIHIGVDPQTAGRFHLNALLSIPFDISSQMEVDLLCADARLAVELDGAQHLADANAYRRDRRKDALLQQNGYMVLRFLSEDVGKHLDDVLDSILRALTHQSALLEGKT